MLKRSIIASGFLHLAVIAVATVSWPHAIALSDEQDPPVVPIDLVTVAEETNLAPTAPEQKPPEPEPQAPPPAQQAAPPPPPEAEVAPADLDKAKPKELPKEAEASPAPAKPAVPRRKPDPQQNFNVDTVLALLDKRAPKAPTPPPNAKPAEQPVTGRGLQNAMTVDLQDALLAQMRECWNVPVGAPNPEQLIVQVRVFLAQDGSLAQPPQLEPATRAAVASNQFMRAAAEAALRAVNVCEPYKRLPPEKYEAWREVVMTFDPSKMAGR